MRHFCSNKECALYDFITHLHTMDIDIHDGLYFKSKRVRNHEYVDMYGVSWWFCDTCHNACQILDKRTRRT